MFSRGKKKKQQEQKQKEQPPVNTVNHTKTKKTNPPQDEGTYDNWIDDNPSSPQVEGEYDDWSTSDHHVQKKEDLPPVEDLYDDFVEQKDVGNQEYEDVTGEGDIFDFGGSKATYTNITPSWANKAPPVKGIPPTKRPISVQPPAFPKSLPPGERPKSMQSPTYMNVNAKTPQNVTATPYEVPLDSDYVNVEQQEGESYEVMDNNLEIKSSYVNVGTQDVGGEAYEEVDDLDLKKSPAAENAEYYEDVLPDDHVKKPPTSASIAERQQQLQKKEIKEPPKKRNLAADYQKMKFEMLAQKFKDIDSGETKPETSDKKAVSPAPKTAGTVNSLTRSFQASESKDHKVNMKGLLWHKAPGRNKYHEEHCELDGNNLKLFRSKTDPKPYFTINTTQCELAAAPEEYEKRNVFKLTAGASRDYFGAFNAGEMKSWMNALKPVVKSAK